MKLTLAAIGLALAATVASWALFLDVAILYEGYGVWGAVVGVMLAPFTFLLVPWYAGIALGHWLPLAVGYGSVAVGLVFVRLASKAAAQRS